MCHQSVGLIQRVIESAGISTVSISINRPYTEKIKPPRSIFLRWPLGHPMGEPGRIDQQSAVLRKALEALYAIDTPGKIIDVSWRWRIKKYPAHPWLDHPTKGKTSRWADGYDCLLAGPITN